MTVKSAMWSSLYINLSPEDALREIKAHGFDYCELSDEHSLSLMERGEALEIGLEFGKFARGLGVEISQGHLLLNAKITRNEDIAFLKRQLDLFRGIGIKSAVLHLDPMTEVEMSIDRLREENCRALDKLLDYIKDTDMVICLENIFCCDFIKDASGLMYFIEHFNSKNLGICLDTGHLNIVGGDQSEFIARAGKHIRALHIADNEGAYDQHLMPFGRGTVDFLKVIREMKGLGYDGLYNLEIPGERNAPLEVLGYKLEYIKRVMDYIDRVTGY